MLDTLRRLTKNIDWLLLFSTLPILAAGLITMSSFGSAGKGMALGSYFGRQVIWIVISLVIFFVFSTFDFRFLRRTQVLVGLFIISVGTLLLLFIVGHVSKGAESWFRVGLFSIQPSDPAKLVLILILAKYFSRRHMEIKNFRHILVSALYALVFFVLILIQPDFGQAIIVFMIWLGMVIVSGISKRHLLTVFAVGIVAVLLMWNFAFKTYQKDRIENFINPLANVQGSGYNAYQSMITVGSGQLFGKGIGYGTQSRLNFLPEYQTDFIFAAFAEEWGFIGVIILLALYCVLIWRIILDANKGETNFEMLYGAGLAILFMSNFAVNVGMNIGILPVTGVTLPFMSYGGSHLITEFLGLAILMGMRQYSRATHKDSMQNEWLA
jgi:rod shape determining protein RodA